MEISPSGSVHFGPQSSHHPLNFSEPSSTSGRSPRDPIRCGIVQRGSLVGRGYIHRDEIEDIDINSRSSRTSISGEVLRYPHYRMWPVEVIEDIDGVDVSIDSRSSTYSSSKCDHRGFG